MTGTIDLKSRWGPFSSNYLGITYILDPDAGSCAEIPLFVGRKSPAEVVLPDPSFDHVQNARDSERADFVRAMPEDVSADYSRFGLRYFIDSHGDSALASFLVEGAGRVRCDLTFKNSAGEAREYFFGLGVTISDTRRKVHLKESLRPWWVPAQAYAGIEACQKTFGLGCRQCLTRVFSWAVEDEVLAQAFGGWSEDRVTYKTRLPGKLKNGVLYLRYLKYSAIDPLWELRINGQTVRFRFRQTWKIPGGGWGKNRDAYEEWAVLRVPIGSLSCADVEMELRCLEAPGNDTTRIWLDGMLFSEGLLPDDCGEISPPTILDEPLEADGLAALDEDGAASQRYRLALPGSSAHHLTVRSDHLFDHAKSGKGSFISALRKRFHLPAARVIRDANSNPWATWESRALIVPGKSVRTVSFTLSFDHEDAPLGTSLRNESSPENKGPYAGLAARLRDLLLFNVNYPFRLAGKPSPYMVPAKYFPLPYSWDGGFIAVGLAGLTPELAYQQATYFFADDRHNVPHIYCGSPVPTPLYAIWEIYQATGDRDLLKSCYTGAKRMYDFYLGRTPGSAVNPGNDGLLTTYAYNYNLGIDDHPIQRWAESCNVTKNGLYSIILIAQIRRLSCVMRNIAWLLNDQNGAEQFGKDAAQLADVIDGRMWDESSGLYGWLHRTERGVEPVVLQGCAGDRSACTFLPLFAGMTRHKDRLIAHLTDPQRFFTPFGISSVDMSSPYYNPDGYWNGGIWPVMQWFLWKGLLESGEPTLAREIAMTILALWQQFLDREHYLGEHFMIKPERMAGAANFGGLSAVLLPMHAAYFTPYQVTAPYDVLVLRRTIDRVKDSLALQLAAPFLTDGPYFLLVNMRGANARFRTSFDGVKTGDMMSDAWGHLSIPMPALTGTHELSVSRSR